MHFRWIINTFVDEIISNKHQAAEYRYMYKYNSKNETVARYIVM